MAISSTKIRRQDNQVRKLQDTCIKNVRSTLTVIDLMSCKCCKNFGRAACVVMAASSLPTSRTWSHSERMSMKTAWGRRKNKGITFVEITSDMLKLSKIELKRLLLVFEMVPMSSEEWKSLLFSIIMSNYTGKL